MNAYAQAHHDMRRVLKAAYQEKIKPFIEAIEYKAVQLNCSYGKAFAVLECELIDGGGNGDCIKMLHAAYFELSKD